MNQQRLSVLLFILASALTLIVAEAATAQAKTSARLCGAKVVNRPDVDATQSLNDCFNAPGDLIELLPGRYYIGSTIEIGARSKVTIRTQGLTTGPACLSPQAQPCAVLVAAPGNLGPVLFNSRGANHLTLSYIALDGNIGARRATSGDVNWLPGSAYNAKIHACRSCRFIGFASVRAPQGTGMEFSGDDAIFDQVLFRDNGWDILSALDKKTLRYADGLTIHSSKNVRIANSTFIDNTDIDLILGNAPGAVIENNVIGNSHSYAFAGLMLDNFNDTSPGDYTGAIIRGNRIDCGPGMCGIGINLGPHMWYPSKPIRNGLIERNTILGARQGLLTNGATGVEIRHNHVEGETAYINGNCVSQALSWSPNDEVLIHDNSVTPSPSRLHGCLPQQLATALHSPPGTDTRIARLYREVLGRNPDHAGGASYSQALQHGASLEALRRSLATSLEAQQVLGRICRQWLHRDLDSEGLRSWTVFLANGGNLSQLQVLIQLGAEANALDAS